MHGEKRTSAQAADAEGRPEIDAGAALDMLAAVVNRHGPQTVSSAGTPGLVAHAMAAGCGLPAGVERRLLRADLRDLWLAGKLPVPMTVGGLVVLRRAQRAERAGLCWGEVLRRARETAMTILDLVPRPLHDSQVG